MIKEDMQHIALIVGTLVGASFAAPAPQDGGPPPSTAYEISSFSANVLPGSIENYFSFDVNAAGTRSAAKCSGMSDTTPPLAYLPLTDCSSDVFQFEWSGSQDSYYNLTVIDSSGGQGSLKIDGSAFKTSVNQGALSYYIDYPSMFEIARTTS